MKKDIAKRLNDFGEKREPFLFVIDYKANDILFFSLPATESDVMFKFPTMSNVSEEKFTNTRDIHFSKIPVSFETYEKAFQLVKHHIQIGDCHLLNLTMPSKIECSLSLEEIFYASKAKYKILIPRFFTVFSPEIFVRIIDNKIHSYPMKGTIDASIENAEEIIMNDPKEIDEQHAVVNSVQNELNRVAKNARVERFRYIDRLKTNQKELLQVSSEVCGDLDSDWHEKLGDILMELLPAASISGTPKSKTLEIIEKAEITERGYYCGIMGIYDGQSLDTAVMIRYIQETENGLQYHSGGGITINSQAEKEYQELIDKVYVPLY
ncbi:MAG: aminodeoxychorismate synthase component I [Bacteroidales bacterium]|nr:aminodeoxychorismate synthase component I [Bacteroidales bacterium]